MTVALLFLVAVIGSLAVGYIGGWDAGTKDTERRWRDAVGRGDNRRHD